MARRAWRGAPSHVEGPGAFVVADGVPEVPAAVREQLEKGGSRIETGAGSGVVSDGDPIGCPRGVAWRRAPRTAAGVASEIVS